MPLQSLADGSPATPVTIDISLSEVSDHAPAEKHCHRCRESKPLAEFSPDASKRDGRASKCRACGREVARSYYATHRAERSVYAKRRYGARKAAEGEVVAEVGRPVQADTVDIGVSLSVTPETNRGEQ